MGLTDDIRTQTAKFEAGNTAAGHQLARDLATMIGRKGSKRLISPYFNDLADTLEKLGRYNELIKAAGGVDPASLGVWDCQAAVTAWLERPSPPPEAVPLTDTLSICNQAAKAIAQLDPSQWAGMVLLVMESLDCEPNKGTFLLIVKQDLETRLQTGSW